MKIGILIPSRERINLKLTLLCSMITTAHDINNIVVYFGIDDDDPTKPMVEKICRGFPFVRMIPIHNGGKFIGINRIWNLLAAECPDEIFGYIGDDMIFRTPDWDKRVLEEFDEQHCPKDKIKLVHCNDGYHGAGISINAFVHRRYYEVVGYFCREEFLINWSDQWMHRNFKAFDRIKYFPDILIEHNHWVFGRRPKDGVADRMAAGNPPGTYDDLWYKLAPQRKEELIKLGKYLNMEPDWKKAELV